MSTIELIGISASVIVAISLTMSSVLKLRLLNLAGSVIFAVYGFLIGSLSVFGLNCFVIFSNIFYLLRMTNRKEYFTIIQSETTSGYLSAFLRYYESDISRFSPQFDFQISPDDFVFFVLRDVVPAGILIGSMDVQRNLFKVRLDYVTPQYRDMKTGKFIFYDSAGFFAKYAIGSFRAIPETKSQQKYLEKIGFLRENEGYLFRIAGISGSL